MNNEVLNSVFLANRALLKKTSEGYSFDVDKTLDAIESAGMLVSGMQLGAITRTQIERDGKTWCAYFMEDGSRVRFLWGSTIDELLSYFFRDVVTNPQRIEKYVVESIDSMYADDVRKAESMFHLTRHEVVAIGLKAVEEGLITPHQYVVVRKEVGDVGVKLNIEACPMGAGYSHKNALVLRQAMRNAINTERYLKLCEERLKDALDNHNAALDALNEAQELKG